MSATVVQSAPSADRRGQQHQGLRLALILVAAFMVVLDFSIVNVALPSIGRELHAMAATVQWVITGYAIAFGGLLILGGRAADLLGRRRMFVTGLLAFTAASLAGGLARDPVLLIASRVIQGAGAALVAPAALSLITTGFAEGAAAHQGAWPVRGHRVRRVRGRTGTRRRSGPVHQLARGVPGQRAGRLAGGRRRAATARRLAGRGHHPQAGRARRAPDHPVDGRAGLRRIERGRGRLVVAADARRAGCLRRQRPRLRRGRAAAQRSAASGRADPPPGAAHRGRAEPAARTLERRRDAGPVAVPPAGAAGLAAGDRPGDRAAG